VEVVVVVVVSGFVGLGVGDTLYMIGLKSVGVAQAVPLAATYPLFSLLWASLLLGQAVTALAVAGTVVILLGIWFLSLEKGDSTIHFRGKAVAWGVAASLLTAVVWSVSITLMDFAVSMPGVVNGLEANYAVVTVRIAGMALLMLALAPLLDREHGFLKLSRKAVVLLCVGGLVANGVGSC
jgi:DME family drug/metabolite transporter